MIIYVSLLTLILSLLVAINNWSVNRSSVFLSGLLLIISFFALNQHFLASSRSSFWLAIVYNNFAPFWYLSGPLLFWYTRSVLLDEISFKKSDVLHLAPFLIHLTGIVPYLLTSFEYKVRVATELIKDPTRISTISVNWLVPIEVNLVARPVLIILYCIASLWMFNKFSKKSRTGQGISSSSKLIQIQSKNFQRWFYAFTGIILLIGINYLITGAQFIALPKGTSNLNQAPLVIFSSGLIAALPILLLVFPDVTYGLPRRRPEVSNSINENPDLTASASESNETDTPDSYFKDLAALIIETFEKRELYLKHDLSADDVVELLSVPRHHLYYCLNTVIGTKFTALKAQYRVQHAKKLLLELDLNRYTIDSIGLSSGFSSRSSFYAAFREITGITPSDFLTQNGRTAVNQ